MILSSSSSFFYIGWTPVIHRNGNIICFWISLLFIHWILLFFLHFIVANCCKWFALHYILGFFLVKHFDLWIVKCFVAVWKLLICPNCCACLWFRKFSSADCFFVATFFFFFFFFYFFLASIECTKAHIWPSRDRCMNTINHTYTTVYIFLQFYDSFLFLIWVISFYQDMFPMKCRDERPKTYHSWRPIANINEPNDSMWNSIDDAFFIATNI